MLDGQKLQLEATEKRAALRKMALDPEAKTEDLTTAEAELTVIETRARIAVAAEEEVVELAKVEPTEDSETRERRELRSKARVSDFVGSVLSGRPLAGASAEYADAEGLPGMMPLTLLDPETRETETRAITPGPANEALVATQATVPFAFARTHAAALGVSMPMVGPGAAHFPAIETSPPAGMKANDAAAASTAAAFALTKREPHRLTGQFLLRTTDLSLLPSMESDLRVAISGRVADTLDAQVIGGDGAGANLDGLFNQATAVAVDGTTETFSTAIVRFAGLVDGLHAHGFGDIRALIGVATFAKYAAIFANANKGDISAYDHLKAKLGGLTVSTRVPVVAASGQKAIAVLTAQGRPIQVPIWSGMEIIVDPYTEAAKGQRVLTAVLQCGSPFIPYGTSMVVEVHPKLS